jgi:hypothetical protein
MRASSGLVSLRNTAEGEPREPTLASERALGGRRLQAGGRLATNSVPASERP